MKWVSEHIRVNRESEGNVVLKWGRETLGKSFSEVKIERDSNNNCEEHLKHKHGEQWELIGIEARHIFKCCMPSMKCVVGVKMHGDRVRKVDKSNTTAVCPVCAWERKLGACDKILQEWGQ